MAKKILLEEEEAKDIFNEIKDFLDKKLMTIPTNLRYDIKGYFRTESYEWTAYRWFKIQDSVTLITRQYLQHPGECQKYLDTI